MIYVRPCEHLFLRTIDGQGVYVLTEPVTRDKHIVGAPEVELCVSVAAGQAVSNKGVVAAENREAIRAVTVEVASQGTIAWTSVDEGCLGVSAGQGVADEERRTALDSQGISAIPIPISRHGHVARPPEGEGAVRFGIDDSLQVVVDIETIRICGT